MSDDSREESLWEVDDIKLAAAGAIVAVGLVVVALVGMFNDDDRRQSYNPQAGSSELRPVHVKRRSGEGESASDYSRPGGGNGGGGGGQGSFSAFQTWEDNAQQPCMAQDFDESVRKYGGLRMFMGAGRNDPCAGR
ncbi:MAG: hypothetical protein KC656_23580 [Myxococcales bacterium]|nr:hypothetical protein [Myxococcales bacterium]